MAADPWLFATIRTLLKRVHALEATLQATKIQLSLADCISHPDFEIAEQSGKGDGDTCGEYQPGFQLNPLAPEFRLFAPPGIHCAPKADAGAHFVGAPPFIPAFSGDEDMIDNKNDCVNNVECDMALVITKAEKILEEFLPASTNSTVTDEIVFDYYLADNFTTDAPADSDKVPEDDGYDEVLAALMLAYGCEANDLDDMPPDTAKEVRRARRRAAEAGAQESRERPFILNGYHCSRSGAVPVDSDACPRLPVL